MHFAGVSAGWRDGNAEGPPGSEVHSGVLDHTRGALMKYIRLLAVAVLVLAASAALDAQSGTTAVWTTPTAAEVDAIYPDIEALYIALHRNPELAFQETRTAATLAARMKALGYEVTTGVGRTGVVAVLKNGPGPTVMLRTELDALPVAEKTGLAFASTVVVKNAAGQDTPVMHACGHDLHMSAWSGTARLMAEHRGRWKGTLVMVGQPAEESGGGASAMLNDGLFTRFPRPDFALSLHDDDTMPSGTIGYRPGQAGIPSALLHFGAVAPDKLARARETGIPVPAPHSPEWAPDREAALRTAIRAEVTALLELFQVK